MFSRNDVEHVPIATWGDGTPSRSRQQGHVFGQAARMMNQVTDGDRRIVRGQLGQVSVDVVIEPQRALLRE